MSLMRQFPELMNLQAASEALHVSRATLHRWLDSGKIQTIKYPDSNRRLITADEVQRMLELGMEKTMPSFVTCIEITVNGERCENRPAEGHDTCGVHLSQKVVRGVHRGES